MILVTGTKRSGTSMWMQILIAAGHPYIGTPFPAHWGEAIAGANPRGFFESRFRQGVFYRTNPDPKTGDFLHPKQVRRHVVKVFVPGLVRTDMAYIHRVVATMRHWREYAPSLARLYSMEDDYARIRATEVGADPDQRVAGLVARRSPLPPAIEWWFETYDLIRDLTTRRYPFHLTTYDRVLADPEAQIRKVLAWIGGEPDAEAACAAVAGTLRSVGPARVAEDADGVTVEDARVFDALCDMVHERGKLSREILVALNETQRRLVTRFGALSREREG